MIVREGIVPVIVSALAAGLSAATTNFLWSLPLVLLMIYLLWLFRDRRREIPAAPLAVLAPVDGKVVFVGPGDDPWLKRDVLRITLALPIPGVTVLISPTEGQVKNFWTKAGIFSEGRDLPQSSGSPDCYAQWIRTDEGDDIVWVVSSAWPVSRTRLDVAPGERAGQGRRNGFVYFATTVDLLCPPECIAKVHVGDMVEAPTTMLAALVRNLAGK